MLSYFIRYRETIFMQLFVPFVNPEVLGFEALIQRKSEAAMNSRLNKRLGRKS